MADKICHLNLYRHRHEESDGSCWMRGISISPFARPTWHEKDKPLPAQRGDAVVYFVYIINKSTTLKEMDVPYILLPNDHL